MKSDVDVTRCSFKGMTKRCRAKPSPEIIELPFAQLTPPNA
jgi:hypothetical protein